MTSCSITSTGIELETQVTSILTEVFIKRLEETYADFIEKGNGFEELPAFFRYHLYAPKNKKERDLALENLYHKLKAITGPKMTENIHKLIKLNKLTDELDLQLTQMLLSGPWKDKKNFEEIQFEQKDLGYLMKEADQLEKRIEQIDLVCETLTFFFSLSRLPMIRLVMAPIKVAASMVGAVGLVDTMETGYKIACKIADIQTFVEAFETREKKNLQDIFGLAS